MNKIAGPLLQAAQPDHEIIVIAPSLERWRLRAYALMLVVDAILIHLAFASASLIYEGQWWQPRTILAAQVLLPVFFTIALYNGSYGAKALRDWGFASRQALVALFISLALLNFLAFYTKSNAQFSRVAVTLGFVILAVLVVAFRYTIQLIIRRFWDGRTSNNLIILDGGPDFALADAERFSVEELRIDPSTTDPFMLDRLGKIFQNQDKVVVSCPREHRQKWAFMLKSAGVYGEIVSEPANELGAMGVHRYEDQDRTTLVVSNGPLGLRSRIIKRVFDMTLAGGAVVLLSPVLLFVALRIKLEDGGPVFFVQRRLGRGNKFFDMYKFRSMKVEKNDENGNRSTSREDDRITKTGAFIRRTSIDELPQILNVLRGEMSIVGPRPHALGSQANNKLFWEVDTRYWARHCLKPGLTGLAQIRGYRGATVLEKDLTDRLQSDLEYISGWSLKRDVQIVLHTVAVLSHDNAY